MILGSLWLDVPVFTVGRLSSPPYFMYGDIDTIENRSEQVVRGSYGPCGLIRSAETSLKKVRNAFQYMIYHLRMNSETGLIDNKENTIF